MPQRANPNQKYQNLLESARAAKRPHEIEAWMNVAFFLNQQYVEWHGDSDSLREIPRDTTDPNKAMPRPVFNKIMHFVRKSKASALRDWPKGDVLPAGDDPGDISDALVATAYVDHLSDATVIDYDQQLSAAVLWALLGGSSWLKWPWNDHEKRPDIIPLSFFEGYADPFARNFDRARYFIHSQFMDPEQVEDVYGVTVQKDDIQTADLAKTALLRGMGSMPANRGVTVNELWYKPCKKYAKGLYVVWAGNTTLVEADDLPYAVGREEGKLPFTQLVAIERPDSVYGGSPVSYMRSGQMAFNQYWAQRILFRRKFQPKWLIASDVELEHDPDDSPAQILRGNWTPGLEPRIVQPSTYMPSDDGELMEQQLMHIVGQHEVSQGQVPGRVEAAKAIETLLNQDDDSLQDIRKSIARCNSQGWYHVLRLAQEFEKQEVMVSAYSPEGVPEVKRFMARKLKPGFRVRTTMTTGLASTRTARQQQLTDLWDRKVIQDPEQMARLLDLPLGSTMADKAADVRLARNENYTLAGGDAIVPNSWDDHAIHLREHNAYRKTNEFLLLSPGTKEKFEHHCQTHKVQQKVALGEQAQLAMIMQGQAPGAPGGPASAPGQAAPDSATTQQAGGTVGQ